MTHLYTARKYQSESFKLLCMKEWIEVTERLRGENKYAVGRPAGVTTLRRHVDCPKCLEILLPKAEAEVAKMRAAYELNKPKEVSNECEAST